MLNSLTHDYDGTPINPPRPTSPFGGFWPRLGWICQRCGRSNSPAALTCPCVQPPLNSYPMWAVTC